MGHSGHSHGTLGTLRDDAWDTRDTCMGHSGHSIQTCGTLRGTLLGYFKGCYRHVTALSQGCHKSGIALSLGHNNHVVTTMSQFCHRGQVSKYCVVGLLQSVSQNYYNSVTGLLEQCHKTITAVS